ncbi:signal peptide peptidase-like 3 [Halichondria panicea]|uniref:signal peptide peptidase-like 3 n=1 Tax=Halichondria panicea TaxID=6063 RepID=UPI00312B9A84
MDTAISVLEAGGKDKLLENVDLSSNEEAQHSLFLWLIDPGRLIIFFISLFLIYNGSQRAVKLDRDSKDNPMAEGVQDLTCYHVVLMPVIGSVMLLTMFYFFEYIQYVYIIMCVVVSVTAFINFIYPLLTWTQDKLQLRDDRLPLLTAVVLSITMATAWVLTGHWLCLDALGMALSVMMIQFVRVPSLKVATLLLLGLLVYDIFWVFYSTSIFNANVMVEVAIKKADNPVAMMGEKLNLPSLIKSRPPLSIPGKLIVPSFFQDKSFAMLGLGDIVLPGLLLCFAMRFDSESRSVNLHGSAHSGGGLTRYILHCRRWSYFTVAMIGYAIGLVTAGLIADLFRAAQPALLYLVPGVLIPLFVKAILQGDFRAMWAGPFTKPPLISLETDKRGYHRLGQYSSSILPS